MRCASGSTFCKLASLGMVSTRDLLITLAQAIGLVFAVMLLFVPNWRRC
jgi:hypothetical protein